MTALYTAGIAPIVPDSPTPLAPSGVRERRRLHVHDLERRQLGRRDHEVVGEVGGPGLAVVVVVAHLLEQRLGDALGDAAVHLALGEQRVDDRAGVVDARRGGASRA